ncbi:MAG: hypothetical protein A2Y24_03180 [Clostridiales bacterium GWE2_32_10]|nr:MAG: hypothetical protein A2Y24_03180 [Clostridiales bacterium GWE2_32_10]HBY19906.1 glycosyltransferase family 1 protein [Clostridiales bacterium]
MKVLHIISGGDTAGAKTHLITLTKDLIKKVDMKILCFFAGEFYNEAKEMRLPVELLNQKSRYDFLVVKRIIKIIKDEKYNIVHCHGSRANWFVFLAKPFIKVPLITTVHSDYKKDFEGVNLYRYYVYTGLNMIALRFFDYYIGVSPQFKSMLMERGFKASKIFSVYNGVDFDEKLDYMDRKSFAKEHGLIEHIDKKWVGIAARLEPVKGLDVFINGAADALKSKSDIHFVIAGAGAQKDELENLCNTLNIKDKLTFIGQIKDMNSFYNAIDINNITSYSESFSYVLLEGARFRKPTISSAVGGIPELIKDEETGLLFESGKHEQYASCVLRLINDYEYAKKLGENLYEHAKANFSVENMTRQHVEIYKQIGNEIQ